MVLGSLRPGRLPSGDDSNHFVALAIAVAHDKSAERRAQAEKDEAILVFGMAGIIEEQRVLVDKDGFRFTERNTVLATIRLALALIPLKSQPSHTDTIPTTYGSVKASARSGSSASTRDAGIRLTPPSRFFMKRSVVRATP